MYHSLPEGVARQTARGHTRHLTQAVSYNNVLSVYNPSVGFIRLCVPFCSEFIWERIKGAFEALPELDPDGYEEDSFTTDRSLAFNYFQA